MCGWCVRRATTGNICWLTDWRLATKIVCPTARHGTSTATFYNPIVCVRYVSSSFFIWNFAAAPQLNWTLLDWDVSKKIAIHTQRQPHTQSSVGQQQHGCKTKRRASPTTATTSAKARFFWLANSTCHQVVVMMVHIEPIRTRKRRKT